MSCAGQLCSGSAYGGATSDDEWNDATQGMVAQPQMMSGMTASGYGCSTSDDEWYDCRRVWLLNLR